MIRFVSNSKSVIFLSDRKAGKRFASLQNDVILWQRKEYKQSNKETDCMMSTTIPFTKMHGLGNDYIYIDSRLSPISNPSRCAVFWSRQHTGIGSDGLVLIGHSEVADFSMRIFNADGSEAMMCGNASRCVGKYVYEKGWTSQTDITLETLSGVKKLSMSVRGGRVDEVMVDMGEPLLQNKEQVATADGALHGHLFDVCGTPVEGVFVCMGNPHLVLFVSDVEHLPIEQIGRRLESHPLFPQRVNIEFAEMKDADTVRMRVWERGSGVTQACGTGACATAVTALLAQRAGHEVKVCMDGGELCIRWDKADNHIYMQGPAVKVFEGTIEWND